MKNEKYSAGEKSENAHKTGKAKSGVCCYACDCVFHEGECFCNADKIRITPENRGDGEENICASFKCRF